MAKNFEIGETEKHVLKVNWNLFMKHIRIELDGRTVADKYHYSPAPEILGFDVGENEKHRVAISIGGFSRTGVRVDGRPLKPA